MTPRPLSTKDLFRPLQYVAGVGPDRADLLAKLELKTVADVLFYFPRTYEDLTTTVRIDQLVEGAEATVVGMRPEHDLAVLQAKAVPDDLQAATLRSTADLQVGDQVVAVGFPFGIGPSASAGVVSGLKREYHSPEGKRVLSNLIQFDAAANPGNSGGPLVTADGEVVGIVTGILNPTRQRVFIGIGFAVPIENAAAAVGMSPF